MAVGQQPAVIRVLRFGGPLLAAIPPPHTDVERPKRVGCPVSVSTHVVAFTDLNAAVAQDGIGGGHVEEKLRQAVVQ